MTIRTRCIAMALAWLALSCAAPALADFKLNMPRGVTATSREVYDLHMLGLWVCVAIGALVYGAMIVAIVRFRKSAHPTPAKFSHNTTMEVVWTVIPAVILVALAVPAAETLIKMKDTRDSKLTVEVTGYQWRWQYNYIDEGVRYVSALARESNAARRLNSGIDPYTVENYLLDVDRPLVVPVDTKVRLLITSADVVHAWWVPDLAVKQDAVPGFVRDAWFEADTEGTYRGQCAELCGQDHGFMPIVVEVLSKEKFAAWLDGQKQPSQ
ncbi:MAG TPA: cytochrome c oxidase subunit II [Vicinamibacterales bacterium]|nr:cytochrome c oxidase subunit II [Vicinamibacterales bacterium]